jgi:thiol-disulfide isomerase/thioredoxin
MKKVWILVAVIVILAGGAVTFVATRERPTQMPQVEVGEEQIETPQSPNGNAGVYADYTTEAVANAEGRVWLFFHAPWCPQCVDLERDIRANGVPESLTILKVDYDTATDLRQRYGVTLQTTIVEIDEEGNEVDKFVAYNDPSLGAALAALGQ